MRNRLAWMTFIPLGSYLALAVGVALWLELCREARGLREELNYMGRR